MHMGHFNKHHRYFTFSDGYHASFSDDNWRTFLQSGVALWMQNVGGPTPCCDLRFIGGDGTSIGIPLGNLAGFKSVWEPSTLADMPETEESSRSGRVAVVMASSNPNFQPSPQSLQKMRTSLRLALSSSVSDLDFGNCVHEFHTRSRDVLPKWFADAFSVFLKCEGRFREAMRVLLRNCISEASVTALIPRDLLPRLAASHSHMTSITTAKLHAATLRSAFPFGHVGILNELLICVELSCSQGDPVAFAILTTAIKELSELQFIVTSIF